MEYWILGLGCFFGVVVIAQLRAILSEVRQTNAVTNKIRDGLSENVAGANSFHVTEGR